MAQWFYKNAQGRECGPLVGSQVLELVRQGEIQAQTEVRKDDSAWTVACQINGLWQAAGRPGVAFRCPYCAASISKPPTHCQACRRDVSQATGRLVNHSLTQSQSSVWNAGQSAPKVKPKAPPLLG
jgi:hypothetical protein